MSNYYLPFLNGRYEVRAGLQPLDKQSDNLQDNKIFQLDDNFSIYAKAKQQSCLNLAEYYLWEKTIPQDVIACVNLRIAQQLCQEYPKKFQLQTDFFLGENTRIDLAAGEPSKVFHELAMLVQEDFTIMLKAEQGYRLVLVHVLLPNFWSPKEKFQSDFRQTHKPVPHMRQINQVSHNLLDHVLQQGPFVRFAWGLTADQQLNCHPQLAKPGNMRNIRLGSPFYVRVERQVLWGIPEQNAVVFTIRTYHYDCLSLKNEHKKSLSSALLSMDKQVLEYKGLKFCLPLILEALAN